MQLVEPSSAEASGQQSLDVGDCPLTDHDGSEAAIGQENALRAAIVGIGLAPQVAKTFEIVNQLSRRLGSYVGTGRKGRQPCSTADVDVRKYGGMRGPLLEARFIHRVHDPVAQRLVRQTEERRRIAWRVDRLLTGGPSSRIFRHPELQDTLISCPHEFLHRELNTMRIARTIHLGVAWLLVVGLLVQVFLAGLGIFAGRSNFETHRNVGFLLQILPFAMAITAWVGKLGRRHIILAVVIFVLFFVQSFLLLARGSVPAIAALHPVNGFFMALLAVWVARDAWLRRRAEAGASEAAAREATTA